MTENPLPLLKKPLTELVTESWTLPSSWYTNADIFELEKQKIFQRSWQYVAHTTQFAEAGDYVTLSIFDQNVFVIKDKSGNLNAFYNVCRHRAHELLTGSGNVKSVIVCPYHAWTYEQDGRLRGARFSQDREDFNRDDFGLRSVRLEIFCGCVFVNLDDNAISLADSAGDLEADMRSRIPWLDEVSVPQANQLGETRIKAGWKVVVDNYVECYHCDHAHPAFAELICMDAYKQDTFGLWSRQLGNDTRAENSAYSLADDELGEGASFWFLWPNTTFNVLPGSRELSVFAVRPISLDVTEFEGHSLTADSITNQARTDYTANVLVPEDISLCESVQRGLHSHGYEQGPIMTDAARSGSGEHALHHFHRLVHDALTEDAR